MNRVFVTGDTHGQFCRIAEFCHSMDTSPDDIMIVLGDAGINYYADSRDQYLKESISNIPITLFCVHGNHEMRPERIESYAVRDIDRPSFKGRVYMEPDWPNIMFGIDGDIYEICERQCIVIGGAYSVDKHYRIAHGMRWFRDEQPSEEIKAKVESALLERNNQIDIVLSHTCPFKYIPTETFLPMIDQSTVDNSTELWMDEVENRLKYGKWLCGHYHTDKSIDWLRFMFRDIVCLNELM